MGEYIRFYRITKDTNVYDSWHGQSTATGATPYQQ